MADAKKSILVASFVLMSCSGIFASDSKKRVMDSVKRLNKSTFEIFKASEKIDKHADCIELWAWELERRRRKFREKPNFMRRAFCMHAAMIKEALECDLHRKVGSKHETALGDLINLLDEINNDPLSVVDGDELPFDEIVQLFFKDEEVGKWTLAKYKACVEMHRKSPEAQKACFDIYSGMPISQGFLAKIVRSVEKESEV